MFFCYEIEVEKDPVSFKLFGGDALLGTGRCASSGRYSPATEVIEQHNLPRVATNTNHYYHVHV